MAPGTAVWGIGNVGRPALGAVACHRALELAGLSPLDLPTPTGRGQVRWRTSP